MFSKAYPDLRLRFLWLAIGYSLVFFVVYQSIAAHPIDVEIELPLRDKLMHAFAYFVLMGWFAQIYHDRFQRNMTAVVFVFMGISLEYIQGMGQHRMFEYSDMLANFIGVALGLALAFTRGRDMLVEIEAFLYRGKKGV